MHKSSLETIITILLKNNLKNKPRRPDKFIEREQRPKNNKVV